MTDQIQQARRAAFELAMRETLLGEGYCLITVPEVMARGSDGRYSSVRIRGAWEGFNAALDAVEIELPQEDERGRITRTSAIRAIESTGLGLKVKS